MRIRRITLAAAIGVAAMSLAASTPALAQTFNVDVIMSGLDNPRGLAFGPGGALYVAESGRGGNGASIVSGDGSTVFYGASGAVSRYLGGVQSRVLTGLPSLAPTGGGSATGLHDIVFTSSGQAFGTIGLGANPSARATLTAGGAPGNSFGQLVRLSVDGSNSPPENFADIAAFEAANNPDGVSPPDSNPYGLVALQGGGFAVTDAGANTLLSVSGGGTVSLRAVFAPKANPLPFGPPVYQSVPTSVAQASNGDLFVGELTGFPFPVGGASVYRVTPGGVVSAIPGGGFTNIIDLMVGADSNLYVLQLTTNGLAGAAGPGAGQLLRVNPNTGARTTLLSSPLLFPGGIAQGADGSFYVSNLSTSAGGGQVLRLSVAAPEPTTLALIALAAVPATLALRRRRKAA